jgi:hypothetical protein
MKRAAHPLPSEAIRLLQPFFPGFDLRRVHVREGIPRYVISDPIGYAERDTIYLQRGAFQPETIHGLALLAHEIAHCQQYDRYGTWRFRVRYLGEYFRNRRRGMNHAAAYWHISFEVQARIVEDLVAETLQDCEDLALPLALVNHDALNPFNS